MKRSSAPESTLEDVQSPSIKEEAKSSSMTIETIEEWFTLYRDRLLGSCFGIIGDFQLAEDIVQETFLTCVRKLDSHQAFRGQSHPYSWLWRLAHNHWIDTLRRKKEKTTYSLSSSRDETIIFYESKIFMDKNTISGLEMAMRTELLQLVQRTLDSINPVYAEILRMRDMDAQGYDEIAQNLRIPVGTVRSRISRGRDEFYSKFLEIVLFSGPNCAPVERERQSSSKPKSKKMQNFQYN